MHINLPNKIHKLYLDFETTSGAPDKDSLNPWHNCQILGAAFTFDDYKDAFYLPLRHQHGQNLPQNVVMQTLQAALDRSDVWINHNVKYDAHVAINAGLKLHDNLMLRDTIVGAKLIDSDRMYKGGYGLTALAKAFLNKSILELETAFAAYLYKNKDYAAIPIDLLAPYAEADVKTARELCDHIDRNMPAECNNVWQTEQKLTKILVGMEQYGLHVNPQELQIAELKTRYRMLQIEDALQQKVGKYIRPHTNADCYDVLCTTYGLPVLGWTEKNEPSFDKFAIKNYLHLPAAPQDIVALIAEYRQLHTALNYFITPYQEQQINGVLHCSYDQVKRTGRMSCKQPNMQQLDKSTKALIHPRAGNALLSNDLSQIEFRLIAHYIEATDAIKAYKENPDTDFHNWVAEIAHIKRRPAKTMNFMMAFGGGKGKTISLLRADEDVIAEMLATNGDIEKRATEIYNDYHAALPTLKPMSRRASYKIYKRNYVQNLFGRRRHIPTDFAHIAFNSLVQSTAADLLKNRTVALHEALRGTGLQIVASVHDETLIEGPAEALQDARTQANIAAIIETVPPEITLTVPIRSNTGVSAVSWAAASEARPIPLADIVTAEKNFAYLVDLSLATC
jgi:DNA polymerase I-like protein with 3'-5' exonuclease and polymerase domains